MEQETLETLKQTGDVISVGVWISAIMGVIPSLAAVLSLIWVVLRIYETKAVQDFIAWIRRKKNG